MFPEGEKEGLYHTADATLWFFHARPRYLKATNDRVTLDSLLPKLRASSSITCTARASASRSIRQTACLRRATRAISSLGWTPKCDGWVVTPRRGKAVEINALWYNALRLLEGWTREARRRKVSANARRACRKVQALFQRSFLGRVARLSLRCCRERRVRRRRRSFVPTESGLCNLSGISGA